MEQSHTPLCQVIENLKQKLHNLVQISKGNAEIYEKWKDVELTYTSNAIEGNTLSHLETALVIEKGIGIAGKPVKDHNEAIDLFEAWQFAKKKALSANSFNEKDVLDLHKRVLLRSYPEEAGKYSEYRRRIAGSAVVFPSPNKIFPLMVEFGSWLSQQPPNHHTAFEAHLRLVSIHPFSDGNGRTSRLLMNMILKSGQYPALAIYPENRKDYLEVIETAQLKGDKNPYNVFMRNSLIENMKDYIEKIDMSKEQISHHEINSSPVTRNSISKKRS